MIGRGVCRWCGFGTVGVRPSQCWLISRLASNSTSGVMWNFTSQRTPGQSGKVQGKEAAGRNRIEKEKVADAEREEEKGRGRRGSWQPRKADGRQGHAPQPAAAQGWASGSTGSTTTTSGRVVGQCQPRVAAMALGPGRSMRRVEYAPHTLCYWPRLGPTTMFFLRCRAGAGPCGAGEQAKICASVFTPASVHLCARQFRVVRGRTDTTRPDSSHISCLGYIDEWSLRWQS